MRVKTKIDMVLYRDIINKLSQAGMFDRDSLDAVHIIYYHIKRKRGVYQPYADDYKLEPKYKDSKEMRDDVAEQIESIATKALGKRLKEATDLYDKLKWGK